jgi:hypothetical protein
MTARPIYVGTGSCRCGNPEVRLYQIPDVNSYRELFCAACLAAKGISVPRPLMAEDIPDKFLFGAPPDKK